MSATLRDLGRFGLTLMNQGAAGGHQVVQDRWFSTVLDPRRTFAGHSHARSMSPICRAAGTATRSGPSRGDAGPILLCLGIHGQMVFVEPATQLVGVKLSSWPTPQDPTLLTAAIAAFRAIGRMLDA